MITVFNPASTQRGAVLIVALVMLLLLTIIGLTGMRGTALQENMASNLRESNTSFQAAEAALLAGERQVAKEYSDDRFVNWDPSNPIVGSYAGLTGMVKAPTYSIIKLHDIESRDSGGGIGTGEPIDIVGVLVRVEAIGVGFSLDENNLPSVQSQLRSTYLSTGQLSAEQGSD